MQQRVLCKGSLYYWGSSHPDYDQVTSKGYLEVKDTGTYWVRVVTSDGCQGSDTLRIRPTANPIEASFLAVSKFKTGDSIQYLDMSHPNPIKWFWDLGDNRSSLDQDPLHVYYACDTFHVVLNVSNGVCQSTLAKDVIVSGCDKSGHFPSTTYYNSFIRIVNSKLYPNPTHGNLTLEVELSAACDVYIYIFNLMGVLQKTDHIAKAEMATREYRIDNLAVGVYLVKIVAAGDQKTYKVIKN